MVDYQAVTCGPAPKMLNIKGLGNFKDYLFQVVGYFDFLLMNASPFIAKFVFEFSKLTSQKTVFNNFITSVQSF